jgi:hypothetical protein
MQLLEEDEVGVPLIRTLERLVSSCDFLEVVVAVLAPL